MSTCDSVDLPDPLGPISACTSPDATSRSTPRRICTPPTDACTSAIFRTLTPPSLDGHDHVVAVDPDGVHGDGLGGGEAQRLAGLEREGGTVLGAFDLALVLP